MSVWGRVLEIMALFGQAAEARDRYQSNVRPLNTLVDIEYLTDGGTWIPFTQTQPDSFFIANALRNAKRQYPNNRVRAVDHNGRMLDMLP